MKLQTLNPELISTVYNNLRPLLHDDERAVMAVLNGCAMSVNGICDACPEMCQPEVSQALCNLLHAGVVNVIASGRHRVYSINTYRVDQINRISKKLART